MAYSKIHVKRLFWQAPATRPAQWGAVLAAMLFGAQARAADENIAPLTTVAAVRRLAPEQAAKFLPVKFRGVITFHSQIDRMLFVQDETGGVYVYTKDLKPPESELPAGTRVEIEGVTWAGKFAPFVVGRDDGPVVIRRIGEVPLPEPMRLTQDQMSDPQNHSQWIEVGGVVRAFHQGSVKDANGAASDHAVLAIGSGSHRFDAIIYGEAFRNDSLRDLVGAQVRLRGVFGSEFNDRRQLLGMRLFVTSRREIFVERAAGGSPFQLPMRPIDTLMQFSTGGNNDIRAHVRGTVTLVASRHGFYMQDESAGLWVSSNDGLLDLRPGSAVEVVGFCRFGAWNPVLDDAEVRRLGDGVLPAVKPMSIAEAFTGEHCFEYVQLEAKLLEVSHHDLVPTFVLEAEGRVFTAQVASPGDAVPDLELGSWLRLRGISLNEAAPTTGRVTSAVASNHVSRTANFRLLVDTLSDIDLVRQPPWWTVRRLVVAVGVLATILCAGALWVILLRRKIAEQTETIRERLARQAVYEERTRIARELHDTLEQEMTGIAIHIDVAAAVLGGSPDEARRSLETARKLLDRSRVESRRSIWELRSTTLEQGGLVAAFEEQASAIRKERGPQVALNVEGEPRRLPTKIETHLYRIGSEALANAVKHSGARAISIALRFEPQTVTVCVEDDGGGFDVRVKSAGETGRFGLLGMKERAAKIQAHFQLDSRAGDGTRVRASAPTQVAEPLGRPVRP